MRRPTMHASHYEADLIGRPGDNVTARTTDAVPASIRLRGVLWLTEAFYPPLVGGQELIAAALAQKLAERQLSVTVVTRQTVPASPPRERIADVEVRRIEPAGLLKGKGWRALVPLAGFLLRIAGHLVRYRRQYEVIVVSGVKVMPLVVVPLARLLGKRCILRAESYFELHEPISTESLRGMGGLGRVMFRCAEWVRNAALRRASTVIAISAQIRAELTRRGVDGHRIIDIPNAVSLEKFAALGGQDKAALRARLGLPAERTIILYSGRLARAKGVPVLIELWPTLFAEHPSLYLVLVGSGNRSFDDCEADAKRSVRSAGMASHVRFIPETRDIAPYLQSADLWVFPTEYEGFSLALAEAMACECVVVATAVGAAPELIVQGESGFLCAPQDGGALKLALEEALTARARWPSIGRAARQCIAPYDLERIADRYAELCR